MYRHGMMKLHPNYPDQLVLADLTPLEEMRKWPDEEGKRGRPRGIKYARIQRTMMKCIMAKVNGDHKFGTYGFPWTTIYKAASYQSAYKVMDRFRKFDISKLPYPQNWEFKVHTETEKLNPQTLVLARWEVPDNFTLPPIPNFVDSEWLQGTWNHHQARQAELAAIQERMVDAGGKRRTRTLEELDGIDPFTGDVTPEERAMILKSWDEELANEGLEEELDI